MRNDLSHISSCEAKERARYPASVDGSATIHLRLLRQLTLPPQVWNTYPAVDFLSTISPAQSVSVKPITSIDVGFEASNLNPTVNDPLMYLSTRFTAFQ